MPPAFAPKSGVGDESIPTEFRHLGSVFLRSQDQKLQLKLFQWDMQANLQIERFYIGGEFGRIGNGQDIALLDSFFSDQGVKKILKLPSCSPDIACALMYKELKTTVTTCAFFDKILGSNIVSRTGVIRRCLNEYHNEISIDDLLKKMMVESDNDENNIFTNVERQEFIYHIFRSVVVGGSLAQADENIFSYISATKSIYKGLLAVIKKPSNPNGLEITSRVYQVRCPAMSHSSLFLTKSSYNSCYVIVDPKKRLITAWHYSYQSFW